MKSNRNIELVRSNKLMVFSNYDSIILYWDILDKSFNKAFSIKPMRVESPRLSTISKRLSIPPPK
jgi:hypothetical protein